MSKKILIVCIFVTILLLVPFAATAEVSFGSISRDNKEDVKLDVPATSSKKTVSNVNQKSINANEMNVNLQIKVKGVLQGSIRGSNDYIAESVSLRWLDCIYLFILREMVWWIYSESPTGSEESDFWYGLYEYLDEKYNEQCSDGSSATSNPMSADCGCIQTSPQSADGNLNVISLEEVIAGIQSAIVLTFRDFNSDYNLKVICEELSMSIHESSDISDLNKRLSGIVDGVEIKAQNYLNQNDKVSAWISLFLTSPIIATQYLIYESDVIKLCDNEIVTEPAQKDIVVSPDKTKESASSIRDKYSLFPKIFVNPLDILFKNQVIKAEKSIFQRIIFSR